MPGPCIPCGALLPRGLTLCLVHLPSSILCCHQAKALFDSLLERSEQLQHQMPSASAISLQAAVDGLWARERAALESDAAEATLAGQDEPQEQHEQQQQQLQDRPQTAGRGGRHGSGGRGGQAHKRQRLADQYTQEEGLNLLMHW